MTSRSLFSNNGQQQHTALKAGTAAILLSSNRNSNKRQNNNCNISSTNPKNTKSSQYRPLRVIGQGAFGVVCMAKSVSDGSTVAIKKVLQDPRYKNRELEVMQLLNSANCVSLLSAYKTKGRKPNEIYLNLVMDFLPMNLNQFVLGYRKERTYPPLFYVKLFSYELFSGLHYLHHTQQITHRDLKPQNILVDPDSGRLKICDFGSAKILAPGEKSVSYIASRYYRAPELMYDCEFYTDSIDIWAAGCVICEMLLAGTPIFPGSSSLNQLYEIVRVVGYPKEEDLRSFRHNKNIALPSELQITPLEQVLPSFVPQELMQLLKSIFVFAPNQRPTAEECLKSPFFSDLFDIPAMPSGQPLPELLRFH